MPNYVLFLQEDPATFADLSPAQMQAIIAEYGAWRQRLIERDRLVDGHKLCDEGGRLLRSEAGQVRVTDGPYGEAKEITGGLFVIRAADYDEAVELTRDCPHLRYGWVELRQVDG